MDAFRQYRTWKRARRLGLSQLACLGRHTLAGLICASGRQADDWSADYRLFARDKWDADDLFVPVVRGTLNMLPENAPLVAAIDDTGVSPRSVGAIQLFADDIESLGQIEAGRVG